MIRYFIKIIISFCVFFFLLCFCFCNYLFDYTLNPHSYHRIDDKIKIENKAMNQEWLEKECSQLSMLTNDDVLLNGYYKDNDSHIYIIMVHGYRGDASTMVSPAKKMSNRKYNILIPELRGHGKSGGDFYGLGWLDRIDIMKWIGYLVGKDNQAKIILYGISLGAATVMNVAGENPKHVVAVIEDCGYSSLWEVVDYQIDIPSFIKLICEYVVFVRTGYWIKDVNPIDQIKKTKIPVLFIHGKDDNFIPLEMMNELYENTNAPKEKLVIDKADHADSFETNPKLYYSTIDFFVEKLL